MFRECTEKISHIWNFYSLNLSLRSSTYTVINPGFRKRLRKLSTKKVVDLHGSRPVTCGHSPSTRPQLSDLKTHRPPAIQLSRLKVWCQCLQGKSCWHHLEANQWNITWGNAWIPNCLVKKSTKKISKNTTLYPYASNPISCEDRCLEPIKSRTSGDV